VHEYPKGYRSKASIQVYMHHFLKLEDKKAGESWPDNENVCLGQIGADYECQANQCGYQPSKPD